MVVPAVADTYRPPLRSRVVLADVLVLWLGSRLLFEVIAVVVRATVPGAYSLRPGFFGLLSQWDSGWFSCILQHGYFGDGAVCATDRADGRPAFFPGYPLLGRAVAWVFGGGEVTAGSATAAMWTVTQIAALFAAWAFYRLVVDRFGVTIARWSVGLLLFGPYAVFLVASYSESMFLAFAIGAWLAMTRRQVLLAGVLGAAASFTRVNGAFLALALIVLYWQQRRRAGEPLRWRDAPPLLLPFAGVAAYFGWLWAATGQPNAWTNSQETVFHRYTMWPWKTLYFSGSTLIRDHRVANIIQHSLEFIAAGALIVCFVVLLRKAEWAAAVYIGLTTLSLMTSTTYLSLARSTLTMFPVFVLAAVVVVRGRHRRWIWTGVGFAGAVTLVNAFQLSRGTWAD